MENLGDLGASVPLMAGDSPMPHVFEAITDHVGQQAVEESPPEDDFGCDDELPPDFSLDDAPLVLKRLLEIHTDPRERFIMLATLVTTLSVLIPGVYFEYDRRRVHSNLMLFVVKPPATGKGVVALAGKLLDGIDATQRVNHQEEMRRHGLSVGASNKMFSPGVPSVIAKPPVLQLLRSAGNITSAKLVQLMHENGGMPLCIIETEADILSAAKKGEHGKSMDAILRQAYHHESVALSRRTHSENILVTNPRLSVILAGTRNQVPALFLEGVSDGLYSRFMIVYGSGSMVWRSGKPQPGQRMIDVLYEEFGKLLEKTWQESQQLREEVTFTDTQWADNDAFWKDRQDEDFNKFGEQAIGISRRYAQMVMRMATVLTFLRKIDPDTGKLVNLGEGWVCRDEDFLLAQTVVRGSYKTSIALFEEMVPKATSKSATRHSASFSDLPDEFTTQEFKQLATKHSVSASTAKRELNRLIEEGMVKKVAHGRYQKIKNMTLSLSPVGLGGNLTTN